VAKEASVRAEEKCCKLSKRKKTGEDHVMVTIHKRGRIIWRASRCQNSKRAVAKGKKGRGTQTTRGFGRSAQKPTAARRVFETRGKKAIRDVIQYRRKKSPRQERGEIRGMTCPHGPMLINQ